MEFGDDFLRGNNLIFTVYLDVENDGIVKASEAITAYKTTVERQCANAQQRRQPRVILAMHLHHDAGLCLMVDGTLLSVLELERVFERLGEQRRAP